MYGEKQHNQTIKAFENTHTKNNKRLKIKAQTKMDYCIQYKNEEPKIADINICTYFFRGLTFLV